MLNVEIVIDGLLASQQTMKAYFLLIIGKKLQPETKKKLWKNTRYVILIYICDVILGL